MSDSNDLFETAADHYLREHPEALLGTSEEFPFIGYLDGNGNILELDVALDIADALSDEESGNIVTIDDIYQRVATEDFWQEDIDDQDENTEQPRYRIL